MQKQTINLENSIQIQNSLAQCLNLLRALHIPFLNLGNLIICPEQKCLLFFKSKHFDHLEYFSSL